ncbi:hypothetical protein ACEU6F_12970 [Aeromonas salmonicida]
MQRALPKIDIFALGPGSFLNGVLVNQSLVSEGIREALKEGND